MTTPWTEVSPGTRLGAASTVTLVDGNTFLVSPSSGDLLGDGIDGLYMLDTRVLSRWAITIDGDPVEGISAVPRGPFSVSLVARALPEDGRESDLAVVRDRHVGRGLREDLELRYFGLCSRTITLALHIGADFASLFEVKGGHPGMVVSVPTELVDGRVAVEPRAAGPVEALTVAFSRPPTRLIDGRVEWDLTLEPSSTFSLCTEIGVSADGNGIVPSHRCGQPIEDAIPVSRLDRWRSRVPRILCDDQKLARSTAQAVEDLGSLRIFDPDHVDRVVVAAGAPWFMTLFGRDALFTAWMALLVDHQLANGVLASLADAQGAVHDEETEEEPGRILHEVRYDHQSARLLGGRNIYYGTVDATPLFVMLVGELARWTGSADLVEPFLPAVDRAITWMETLADRDGDGFLEYHRSASTGLANQGWKDSWDGIRFADGTVAESPIALCEVQAYAYAAYQARADLAVLCSDGGDAAQWRERATRLQARFEDQFWLPGKGWYAVGLGRDKQPIDSLTSNIGHCLWTGIASPEQASLLAERMASDDMFTGWGLRTLAASSAGYNPISYHCGSVWPHDTAIAIAGLARYHQDEAAGALFRGLVDAAATAGGRLPELFAGFERGDLPAPVPYPSSCSPQAWAAAAPLLLVRAVLGLEPDLINGRVHLRPRLPEGMNRLVIDGLPLGTAKVRIEVDQGAIEVDGLPPDVELIID
jgi:glycogen debranching enzyme